MNTWSLLTFLFDGRHVDGPEGGARSVARLQDVTTQSAGESSQRGGGQVERGARLHDGPWTAGPYGQPVSRCVVPGQVRFQLELLHIQTNISYIQFKTLKIVVVHKL